MFLVYFIEVRFGQRNYQKKRSFSQFGHINYPMNVLIIVRNRGNRNFLFTQARQFTFKEWRVLLNWLQFFVLLLKKKSSENVLFLFFLANGNPNIRAWTSSTWIVTDFDYYRHMKSNKKWKSVIAVWKFHTVSPATRLLSPNSDVPW